MFAIVEIGGNQYRVTAGDVFDVDRLMEEENSVIYRPSLLVADKDWVKLGKEASDIKVVIRILKHTQGKKIDTYRFKAKSRYRKHTGFRAKLTSIKIESIDKPQIESKPKPPPKRKIRKTA